MKRLIFIISLLIFSFSLSIAQQAVSPTIIRTIVMRDGKKIAVDIYIPDTSLGQKYSTILVQTPYNRKLYRTVGLPFYKFSLAGSPFAFLIADWRCFYESDTACVANYDRGKDGYDLTEWIASQSWSNGKVGTTGASALGKIQFLTAKKNPPHLVCCNPYVAGPQYEYEEYYPGGVYRTEYVEQLDNLGFGLGTILKAHQYKDILWQYLTAQNYYPDSIKVPNFMVGGWYDHNVELMLDFFSLIRQYSPANVRDKHKLLMGPWAHGGFGVTQVGTAKQGELYYYEAAGWSDSLSKMFLKYYLLNEPNGWDTLNFIKYFQMGENTWANTPSWPPSGTTNYNLYFYKNGEMSTAIPVSSSDYDSIIYNPRDLSPSIGGPLLRHDLKQGPWRQDTAVENRDDILTFSSVVLGQNVVMKGKATVHLFVSSDRKDTDFDIRLTDVYPDGRSMLLCTGAKRMRFRNGYTVSDTASMIPGQVYHITVDLPNTCITFLAGHKIRVDVTSSDYPQYDCNLNNGGPMLVAGDTLIANNRVYLNSNYASYIELPLKDYSGSISDRAENNSIDFTISPNPTSTFVEYKINNPSSDYYYIDIYNVCGVKVISTIKIYKDKTRNKIDVSAFNHGVYFIKLYDNKGRNSSKKLIVN